MRALFLALCLFLSGCSIVQQPGAYGAIAADTTTTVVGLAQGATELNPLGLLVVPLSIGAVEYAATLPAEEGMPIVHSVSAWKWGAAVSNALMLLGAGPASLVVGGAVVWQLWQSGADEREYAVFCANWIAQKPGNTCKPFKEPA